IEGSFGKFFDSKNPPKNQIWIGGGIGITPFVSMARSLQKNGLKIDLYYTFSSRDKAPFLEELLEITSRLDNFRLFPYGADQEGFITCQAIINKGGSLIEKNLFLCGPPIMISSLKNQFKKVGIPKKNIHSEEFNYL
ncbi:MAG: hypothetical protein NTV62_02175, partial [Candidatus Gribaldobacteria bacterium]|nr:hypothetical protein [Candidatus Gribaldobacteria bacterium]